MLQTIADSRMERCPSVAEENRLCARRSGRRYRPKSHGVDGDEGAFELPRLGQLVEQIGDGCYLVGFLGHAELRQREAGVRRIGAERVEGFERLALVVRAA
jgi:hypothetical protein